ncbi:hypothetical protein QVH35_03770 [Candidatus Nitrosotenuis chungbukensis]|uniref:hypothetical protein n=1 Tax=Candidatus Nitrosotenuis chungbukensis TaxID=1353246 RepID=UPI0012FE973E|nr:hypothetical protein [Candidatus Nitrosotenuis chungbukensis]WKT58512.1 hypothetical protein QVH35_03770 [Candidatus Nitrosotenuis chungbukensis]
MTTFIEDIENYLDTEIVDDKDLVSIILRVGLSAYTKNPLNLMVKAPSSEGKSYAVNQVISLFPNEDVLFLGGMSPSALIHERGIIVDENDHPIEDRVDTLDNEIRQCHDTNRKRELEQQKRALLNNSRNLIDMGGKILVFLDTPDWNLWRKLKPILSHDRESIQFKVTDKTGKGTLMTKNTIIRGWPAVIYCSAKNEEGFPDWAEIETRFLIASPNTEIAKYKKANHLTATKQSIPHFAETMLCSDPRGKDRSKCYVGLLKKMICEISQDGNGVYNPFYRIIAELLPSNEGAMMRVAKQFFALCNLETFINSYQRCKIVYEKDQTKKECPIVSLHEIERTILLLGKPSHLPPDKVKFFEQVFEKAVAGKIDGEITSADLAVKYREITGKSTNPKKILENYLTPLYYAGVLASRTNPNDARGYLYKKISDIIKREFDYIREKIIEQSKADPLFVKTGIDELEKHSTGYTLYIIDKGRNTLPKEHLQEILLGQNQTNVTSSAQA